MKVNIYSQQGKKIDEIVLPKEIFDIKVNSDLIHQTLVSQMANRRRVIAHTKDRSEVRGGGRKPWRQKGTGRARHGSIRSPIWRGGGVTFGPTKNRVFKKKINKKMRRKALFMVLSAKAKEKLIIVLDDLELKAPKTKEISKILKKILPQKISAILALPKKDENVLRAGRNIPNFQIMEARNLNVFDLLSLKHLILTKETIDVIKNTFLK
ncbi:MAG: 50S ribosomal protein L4 [Candidatus Nealsonbacteria bacterium RBG_13_36_15]|uniref:Large ribosomal subunit protein uL4 n=1 Tax=Candidatus Nealsonbacteria bacterium RBG_13_36_15 TaxID=1801660 RepID=A0A1G2DW26_9BACT|nr:MAG: 50S ribosomal protein L4 [Candidatus Nealsonbacteria bacterium RBG_13_36_15]